MNNLELFKSLPSLSMKNLTRWASNLSGLNDDVENNSQELLSSSIPNSIRICKQDDNLIQINEINSNNNKEKQDLDDDNNRLKVPSYFEFNRRKRSVSLYINKKFACNKNLDADSKFKSNSSTNTSIILESNSNNLTKNDENVNLTNIKKEVNLLKRSSPTSSFNSSNNNNNHNHRLKHDDLDSGLCSSNEDNKSNSLFHLDDENEKQNFSDTQFQIDMNDCLTAQTARKNENTLKNRALFSLRRSFNKIKLDRSNQNNTPIQLLNADEPSIIKRKYYSQRNQFNIQQRFEMPCLLEQSEQLNENSSKKINILVSDNSNQETETLNNNNNHFNFNNHNLVCSMTNIAESSSKSNLLTSIEYLINSKSNYLNTKQAIANIAAAAAIHDSTENIEHKVSNESQIITNTNQAVSNVNNNNNISTSNNINNNNNEGSLNEYFLHSLFMDISSHANKDSSNQNPIIPIQSQFDLSSTASMNEPSEISFLFQNQFNNINLQNNAILNDNNNNNNININNINLLQISHTGSGNNVANISNKISSEFNSNFNNSFNNNTLNNSLNTKKQINEHILRTCMGYLDFINKKHNRERRLQTIRNKISGFILLMLVFIMILSLGMIMTFSLTRELTKIITAKSRITSPDTRITQISSFSSGNSNQTKKSPIFHENNNRLKVRKKNNSGGSAGGLQTLYKFSPALCKIFRILKKKERTEAISKKYSNYSKEMIIKSRLGENTKPDTNNKTISEENLKTDINFELEKMLKYEIKIFTEKLASKFAGNEELNINKKLGIIQTELFYFIVSLIDDDYDNVESETNLNVDEDIFQSSLHYYKYIDELDY